jgi:hypothetical protein
MVYYYGDTARKSGFQDTDQYVRKVMDFYNRLEERRQALDVTAALNLGVSHHLSG